MGSAPKRMSACGVLCSDCPAFLGRVEGEMRRKRTAEAWRRIYGLDERPEAISCGGCLAPDDAVFRSCRTCSARLCCRSKGFSSCADCDHEACPDLARAQSVWDSVPALAKTLSRADCREYAEPYCGHRRRLSEARAAKRRPA
jgi:hypothetical protein